MGSHKSLNFNISSSIEAWFFSCKCVNGSLIPPSILLIFCEKIGFGSKFRVGSVYILLESYLDNNQPVKWEKSKRSKYTNFSWWRKMLKFSGMSSYNIIFYELEKYEISAFECCIWNFHGTIFHDFIVSNVHISNKLFTIDLVWITLFFKCAWLTK